MFWRKTFRYFNWIALAATGAAVLLYFFFEMNMIDVIHDYYMLPFLPPIFVLVAYGIKESYRINATTRAITLILLAVLPLVAFRSVDNYWSI